MTLLADRSINIVAVPLRWRQMSRAHRPAVVVWIASGAGHQHKTLYISLSRLSFSFLYFLSCCCGPSRPSTSIGLASNGNVLSTILWWLGGSVRPTVVVEIKEWHSLLFLHTFYLCVCVCYFLSIFSTFCVILVLLTDTNVYYVGRNHRVRNGSSV